GEASVRLLAREGARVVVCDVRDDEGKALAAELGDNVAYNRHDVSSEEEWDAAIAFTLDQLRGLQVLVNNAGIAGGAPIAQHTLADYERLVAVNQVGVFLGIRGAI